MIKVLSLLLSVVILQLGCFSGNSVLLDRIFKGFFVDAPETAEANNGEDRIHYIKLPHSSDGVNGDAILIESNGHFGLIDAGNPKGYENASGENVWSYLRENDVSHLDFIIATHSHSDHIGGMPCIAKKYKDKNLVDSCLVNESTIYFYKTYDDSIEINNTDEAGNSTYYVNALNSMNGAGAICINTIEHNVDGKVIVDSNISFDNNSTSNLDDDYISFVFGDLNISIYNLYNRTNMRENTNSIVTYIEHKDSKIKTLLMADLDVLEEAEQKIGKAIINKHPGAIDVLKVGHHGHAGSTSKELIDELNPQNAIISCNSFKTYLVEYDDNNQPVYSFSPFFSYLKMKSIPMYKTCDAKSGAIIQDMTNKLSISGADEWEPEEGPNEWVRWIYNIPNVKDGKNSYFWVFIKSDGSFFLNNWFFDNRYDSWYFLDANGLMEKSCWRRGSDGWYYLGESGAMVIGWKSIGGKWYYFDSNGLMQTGWIKDDGEWYYLENSGAMATGWKSVDGKWYYLNSNGSMKTGWFQYSGSWYYMNHSGIMQTGWQKIGGKWYYFYSNGKMASDEVIDGYYVNEQGEWQD